MTGGSFDLTALSNMFADFAKQLYKFFEYLKDFAAKVGRGFENDGDLDTPYEA